MLDLEQLLKANKAYQDQAGRWIIRDPAAAYKLYPKCTALSQAPAQFQFASGILHPEDRLARINLSAWFEREWRMLPEVILDDQRSFKQTAASLNMLALILASAGLYQQSSDLCHLTIELFFKMADKKAGPTLSFTLQPWINLSRLDRLLGNYSQALLRLDHLNSDAGFFKHHDIISQARDESYGKNSEITRVIDNCRVIDYLKTVLEMNPDLVSRFPVSSLTSPYLKSTHAEILLLSWMKKQNYLAALDLANQQFCEGDPRMVPIFALRRAELMVLMGDLETANQELKKLLNFALQDLLPKDLAPDLNNLAFCGALVNLAQLLPKNNLAVELAKQVLAQYQELKDELGVIRLLTQLGKLGFSAQYREELDRITKHSDYVFISGSKKAHGHMIENACRILDKIKNWLAQLD